MYIGQFFNHVTQSKIPYKQTSIFLCIAQNIFSIRAPDAFWFWKAIIGMSIQVQNLSTGHDIQNDIVMHVGDSQDVLVVISSSSYIKVHDGKWNIIVNCFPIGLI